MKKRTRTSVGAFYGLAGDFVRAVKPYSEADPYGLLAQFLVALGNVVGHGPYFRAEEDRHTANIFCVLVGRTSIARKGTSLAHVLRLFAAVDPGWAANDIQSGLSSGEGLIHAVRDPLGLDPGVKDKRKLVVETEFGVVLRVLNRTGNILSPVLRQAWDSGNLQVLSKHTAAKAKNAHISVIGHITEEELIALLRNAEVWGGTANRFLWVAVTRSKLLPNPGHLPDRKFKRFVRRLRLCVKFAQAEGELKLTKTARRYWEAIYGRLGEGATGRFGAAVSRAESQVLRLAAIYALLDRKRWIRCAHLLAAESFWRYCHASAASLFALNPKTSIAERLKAIFETHPEGISMTEISAALGHHVAAKELRQQLSILVQGGWVRRHINRQTGGRPRTTYSLSKKHEKESR